MLLESGASPRGGFNMYNFHYNCFVMLYSLKMFTMLRVHFGRKVKF